MPRGLTNLWCFQRLLPHSPFVYILCKTLLHQNQLRTSSTYPLNREAPSQPTVPSGHILPITPKLCTSKPRLPFPVQLQHVVVDRRDVGHKDALGAGPRLGALWRVLEMPVALRGRYHVDVGAERLARCLERQLVTPHLYMRSKRDFKFISD